MRISRKGNATGPERQYVIGVEISPISSAKYLRVETDHDLSWRTQFGTMDTRCRQRHPEITAVLCDRAKMQNFKSLVIPVTDYCSVIFCLFFQYRFDLLENCQMLFLRKLRLGIPSAETKMECYVKRLEVLKWDSIVCHRIRRSYSSPTWSQIIRCRNRY